MKTILVKAHTGVEYNTEHLAANAQSYIDRDRAEECIYSPQYVLSLLNKIKEQADELNEYTKYNEEVEDSESNDITVIYLEQNINKDEFSWRKAADAIVNAKLADGFTVSDMVFEDEEVLVKYFHHDTDETDYVRFKQA